MGHNEKKHTIIIILSITPHTVQCWYQILTVSGQQIRIGKILCMIGAGMSRSGHTTAGYCMLIRLRLFLMSRNMSGMFLHLIEMQKVYVEVLLLMKFIYFILGPLSSCGYLLMSTALILDYAW